MSESFFQWAQLALGSGLLMVSLKVSVTIGRYMQRLETLETSFDQFVKEAGPKIDRIETDMSWLRGRLQHLVETKVNERHGL